MYYYLVNQSQEKHKIDYREEVIFLLTETIPLLAANDIDLYNK